MTIREAAQRIGKSESALRRAIKAGKLDSTLVNGKYDITEEALYAYAEPSERVGAPKRCSDSKWTKMDAKPSSPETLATFAVRTCIHQNTTQKRPSVT